MPDKPKYQKTIEKERDEDENNEKTSVMEKRMQEIALTYHRALHQISLTTLDILGYFGIEENEKEEKGDEKGEVRLVKVPRIEKLNEIKPALSNQKIAHCSKLLVSIVYILNALEMSEASFLMNNYFAGNDPKWWKNYYSKTGYQRMKRDSLRDFFMIYDGKEE